MLKKINGKYEVNGEIVSFEEAIEYALQHPKTYQVYDQNGILIIRTIKGGFDLD